MQISGRNFLPELCGEVQPQTAPPQALCCGLCSTEQSTVRGGRKGEKVPRKGEEEGWPAKGGKKEKRTRENRSAFANLRGNVVRTVLGKSDFYWPLMVLAEQ